MLSFLCIPVSALLFCLLDKERMPYIAPEDALVTIDWNSVYQRMRTTGECRSCLKPEKTE